MIFALCSDLMATYGGAGPMGGRSVQLAFLAATAIVLLWVTTPQGTLAFLIRSPLILARDLIARIRPVTVPAMMPKPVGSPFISVQPANGSGAGPTSLPVLDTRSAGSPPQDTGSVATVPPGPSQPGTPVPLPESPVPLPESPAPLPESPVPLPETPVPLPESPAPLPEVPDLPEPGDLPGAPDLPGPGNLPEVPDLPDPGNLPGLPGLPDLPLPGG